MNFEYNQIDLFTVWIAQVGEIYFYREQCNVEGEDGFDIPILWTYGI